MPDPNGFMRFQRRTPSRRPVALRLLDWHEVYPRSGAELGVEQATRCMDCGVPFCHQGCPLGNRIPDWNDLVRTEAWDLASESLHATNNFPEFTGRLCPAPCESACVLGIVDGAEAVAIKAVENEIIDRAVERGTVVAWPAPMPSGRRVAVVGSGPAGLAAAQQLARAGHAVTVYERDDAVGGLLRFGIPDFKLAKHHVDRRVAQLMAEGVEFVTGCAVGSDLSVAALRDNADAVLLACGALAGRDMPETPGRGLRGIHQAMEHLVAANRSVTRTASTDTASADTAFTDTAFTDTASSCAASMGAGSSPEVTAAGKHVVIIGGGDTAADCLGVAHRQGALSVTQLDRYPQPPSIRDAQRDPWPTWPWIMRSYPAHEEGGERTFAVAVKEFLGDADGRVRAVLVVDVTVERLSGRVVVTEVADTERRLPADLVLLAVGFAGTEPGPLLAELGLARTSEGVLSCGSGWQTEADGVFVAGDMHRGASLVVWAIAEGRSAASAIHAYLGGAGVLPAPVSPSALALRVR